MVIMKIRRNHRNMRGFFFCCSVASDLSGHFFEKKKHLLIEVYQNSGLFFIYFLLGDFTSTIAGDIFFLHETTPAGLFNTPTIVISKLGSNRNDPVSNGSLQVSPPKITTMFQLFHVSL